MNKAITVFLFLAGLIALTQAAEHLVNVGTKDGKNLFEPDTVNAAMGDTVKFVWVSGKHNVIESDAKGACTASKAPNAFTTEIYEAPKEWVLDLKDVTTPKKWFYCSVGQHCANGMTGTILIGGDNKTAPADGKTPDGKAPASAAAQTYTSAYAVTAGVVFSSMCMAAYML